LFFSNEYTLHVTLTCIAFQFLAHEFLGLDLSLFSTATCIEVQYFKSRFKSYK